MEDFFRGIFLEDFLEEFFGRNYLVEINKELMFCQDFGGNFVSMHRKEGRKKFRSLEVRCKLIALKKGEKLTKIGALSFSSVTYMTSVEVDDLANGISPLSVAVTITE